MTARAFAHLARKTHLPRLGDLEQFLEHPDFLSGCDPAPIGAQRLVLHVQLHQHHIQPRLTGSEPCVLDREAAAVDFAVTQQREQRADLHLAELVGVEHVLVIREGAVRNLVAAEHLGPVGAQRLARFGLGKAA